MILASRRATVVFPAPLSPTTAVTLPASRRTETLSTARIALRRVKGPRPFLSQKYLTRLRPSSTAGAEVITARSPASPWEAPALQLRLALVAPVQAEPQPRHGAASTRPRAPSPRAARAAGHRQSSVPSPSGSAD